MPKLVGKPGHCDRCGSVLTGRRTRWCSADCAGGHHREVLRNHDWHSAREAALDRDGRRCVKCGGTGLAQPEEVAAIWRSFEERVAFAASLPERHQAMLWAEGAVREADRQVQLEVNHIAPRRGRGYGPGCHHHLDNLETLCKPCHVAVTNLQREAS